jgi:hypothetical protein
MNTRKDAWEPYEDEFLIEVYPLREWSVETISQKLERTTRAVMQRAVFLEVHRPKERLDYDSIKRLVRDGYSASKIAKDLACTTKGVRDAIKRMEGKSV